MYIFIFLSLYIKIINILSEPLVLNFKTRRINNDENFMKTLINNDIYTYCYFGEKKQEIEMNIKSQKSSTFVLPKSCPNNIKAKKFDEMNSNSYKVLFKKQPYYMYEFKEATLSADNLLIKQNNNKEIEIKEYNFMLVNAMWDNYQEYMGGMLGLKLQNKEDLTLPEQSDFINQLKSNNLINSYVFVLVYNDDYNGNLYIGDYFHTFNKDYSEKNFMVTKAGYENFKVKNWEINIQKIISGNQNIQNKTYFQLFYELGIVAAPNSYQYYINHTFFKDYLKNGICKEILNLENIAGFKKYNYISCDKDKFEKSGFPRLKFYNREMDMNFTLSYNELFYEFQNKIYFLIIFPIYGLNVEYWLMGKPFIKKYKLFLDKDKKIIGLYKNYTEIKEQEQEEKNATNYTGYIVVIIILVVVLIISIISILYYFLVVKKSRRIRANELDDSTDYISQKDDNKFIIN